jgi:hypothetical protein
MHVGRKEGRSLTQRLHLAGGMSTEGNSGGIYTTANDIKSISRETKRFIIFHRRKEKSEIRFAKSRNV